MHGLPGVEEEDHLTIHLHRVVWAQFRLGAEFDHGDAPHGDAVEVAQDGLHRGELLAEPVEGPMAGPVELHHDRPHLGGDGLGDSCVG